jgi:putative ATP-binding cassette transporter
MTPPRFLFLRHVWSHLIRPYWTSEDKWIAIGLLSGYLVLMLSFIGISVKLNYLNNDIFTALQNLDSKLFFYYLGIFLIIAFFSIAAYTAKFYLLQTLEIRWRRWLTHHLIDAWLHERRYYALQLKGDGTDNPDQRISYDVYHFIDMTLKLSLGLFQQVITIFSFLGILWGLSGTLRIPLGDMAISIPGYMCWGALIYALGGTLISFYLGRPLIRLNYEFEKREANFRYSLVRFRENTEGIALYKGEEQEKGVFRERINHIVENVRDVIKQMVLMNSWGSLYEQIQHLFPFLLAAPRFFAQEITFGGLTQTMAAFRQVSFSLSFIITNFKEIASWRATTNRLLEFKLNLEQIPPAELSHEIHEENAVHINCMHISLPHGALLNEDIELTIPKGQDTLITGPTGAGKSTLTRAIAGLWPYGNGSIKVPSASFLFLPQKPYMPLGSLMNVLCYPALEASEDQICSTLKAVGLEEFQNRLHEINDWARVLSLGEQQRIAIARALLVRPEWLVLDEATSAMDEASEAHLYKMLKTTLPETTLISIGHRESLKTFHASEIRLGEVNADGAVRAA